MAGINRVVPLAEVKALLTKDVEERELNYEKRLALEHAENFTPLDREDIRSMIEKLLEVERLELDRATKLADMLPLSPEEVRAIFAKERYTLSQEQIDQIITIIKKFV